MATALVTQIAYAVQTLFDPAGTAGRLVDLGKLANYGLLTSFTPAALFTTGVNGAWLDPSDFSTMFQDAAGTTPVTDVGQPVGLILDKSGRSNHAYNPSGNSANFPVLQQDGTGRYYLAFNGVNQWLRSINSIDFTYGDKMFVSAGVRKLSEGSFASIAELSASSDTNNGTFQLAAQGSTGNNAYRIQDRGAITKAGYSSSAYPPPTTNIVSASLDMSTSAIIKLRVDTVGTNIAGDIGAFGNYPLYIGARAGSGFFFNGRLYGLVVAGKAASASEIASTEAYLNQKTGAY